MFPTCFVRGQSASKTLRVLGPPAAARVMIHQPWYMQIGSAQIFQNAAFHIRAKGPSAHADGKRAGCATTGTCATKQCHCASAAASAFAPSGPRSA
eukprot:8249002-Pyramimonas_sp.AAC.1